MTKSTDRDERHDGTYTHQKAAANWFSSRPVVEATDIFTPEWNQRIEVWRKQELDKNCNLEHDVNLNSVNELKKLSFSCFFFKHPISAVSLWNVVEALQCLDIAVCGKSDDVVKWRSMKPFVYLKSTMVTPKWKESFSALKREIAGGIKDEDLRMRYSQICTGALRLEDALKELKVCWDVNLRDYKGQSIEGPMLTIVEDVVDKRFQTIVSGVNLDDTEADNARILNDKGDSGDDNFREGEQLSRKAPLESASYGAESRKSQRDNGDYGM